MARIAIVGMACLFPGAPDMQRYWDNICNGIDAISDVPATRWDPSYFDPTSMAVDRFYCKRGGFVDDFTDFDPVQFGIMPRIAEVIEPDQLLTLKVGFQALQDAGYDQREFPRERTGVIVGRGNYVSAGVLRLEQHVRMLPQIIQTLRDLFPDLGEEALAQAKERLQSELPYYGPDVASGLIPNLIASRLANRLDLHGPAYTVDAACASSVLAVEQACSMLARGDVDMMLVGGAHLTHDLTFWATFCQLGALSRRGIISPFSAEADGILAGEGVGMVVLKRLDDALTAGDRIYAVIEGTGSSSDGRNSSLVAPSSAGQTMALERAWADLPFMRDDIGLVEAHGTGTPAGDEAELETMAQFFGGHVGDIARPVIGSVKSMIGHTMPASGMAALIKTALAVYHGVLPPTLHCQQPHPRLSETRFRVLAERETWALPREQRIAALNAFGFGGINGHVVLRGAPEQAISVAAPLPAVLMLAAESIDGLLEQLDAVMTGQNPKPCTVGNCRLVVISPDNKRLSIARKAVVAGKPWRGRQQIWFTPEGLITAGGKIAFVFPGVDSSFSPQAIDLAELFKKPLPAWCETLDPAQDLLKVVLGLLGFNRFLFEILLQLDLKPDAFAGHSVGEWSAMLAAGMMDQGLSDRTNAGLDFDAVRFPDVQFLAASCSDATLSSAMAGLQNIALSHDNCPNQVIACGQRESIAILSDRLSRQNIFVQVLPIVSGFHSPLFADHMDWYREFFGQAELQEPQRPVWSATSTQPFPLDMVAKRQLALDHLLQPVRFRHLIENMYEDGFRVFVQVGTGSLPGFIDDTLSGQPHLAIHANHDARSGLEQLQMLSAALWVEGADFDLQLLQATSYSSSEISQQPTNILSLSTRRLSLGIPLLRVREPLPTMGFYHGHAMAEASPLIAIAANDPMGRLVQETLIDIEQAGRDVFALWQRHRSSGLGLSVAAVSNPSLLSALDINTRVTRLLDLDSTIPCVRDHELYPQRADWPIIADRHPVVPMTMEIMLVREAVERELSRLKLDLKVIEVRDIHAYNWLTVTQPVSVEINLKSVDAVTVATEIVGYFKANIVLASAWPVSKLSQLPELQQPRPTAVNAQELYSQNWMFHGPAYQGVESLQQISDQGVDQGIDGILRVPTGVGSLLDNMGQLAGYWVMEQQENCLAMPIGVDCIRFHSPDPLPQSLTFAQVRIREVDALNCISDHLLRDEEGRVCITIEGWRTRRYQMDKAFWEASRMLSHYEVSRRVPPNITLFEDHYDTAILRDYISRRYLTEVEREVYEKLAPRRRRDWLSGRVAVKDAVRVWLREQGKASIYPQEMIVVNDDRGKPQVRANITDAIPDNLQISITHKDHLAAAIVDVEPVGIDIERIETRAAGFVALAFDPQEQDILLQTSESHDIAYTRGWVAKEVVAKMKGTGLGGHLGAYRIEARDGDCLQINGYWIVTHQLDEHVIGWSMASRFSSQLNV